MISYAQALDAVLASKLEGPPEREPLGSAFGRVLAEDVVAKVDAPAFDNSAMDGYGVRAADLSEARPDHPISLSLTGVAQAGVAPSELPLQAGETVRIFTGAPTPPGVDAVVMQEQVGRSGDSVRFTTGPKVGENIRRRGEEYPAGTTVLRAGTPLSAAPIALAAAAGHSSLALMRRPAVGILVTGTELVDPGGELQPGQIFESNSYAVAACLRSIGLEPSAVASAGDTESAVHVAISDLLQVCDVVITTGGVSVGDYDVVRDVLPRLAVREVFWGVAIKPGKPVYFGRSDTKFVLGLPGNPLSVLVTMGMLGLPLLRALHGSSRAAPVQWQATLAEPITKKAGRLEFVPAILDPASRATPLGKRGSHMLSGIACANCLVHFPADLERLEAGASVTVTPLAGSLS